MLYRIKFRILTDEASEKFVFNMKARQEFPLDRYFRPILSDEQKPVFRLLVNGESFVKATQGGYKLNGTDMTNQFVTLNPGDTIVAPTHSIEIQDCPVTITKPSIRVLDYTKRFRLSDSQAKWSAIVVACIFLFSHHEWASNDSSYFKSNRSRNPSSVGSKANQDIFLAIKINNISRFKRLVDQDDGRLWLRDDQGKTPIMEAAFLGRVEIIRLSSEYKKVLNLQDHAGNTALMWAIINNQLPAVKELLLLGIDTKLQRKDGLDALAIAQKRRQNEIAAAILQARANK